MARKRKSGTVDIDMTPMIDVTFQLITFFMFTINFTEAEQDQRIQLPTSQVAKPVENSEMKYLTLQLWFDPRAAQTKVIYAGEAVEIPSLGVYLENEKSRILAEQEEPSSRTVIVRADGVTATGDVQKVIRSCQEKGFDKFVLRAEYKGP